MNQENETAGLSSNVRHHCLSNVLRSFFLVHSNGFAKAEQRKHPMCCCSTRKFSLILFTGIPFNIWKSSSEELKTKEK